MSAEPCRIPLTRGKHVIVDAEDFSDLSKWKWCVQGNDAKGYYAVRWESGMLVYMHKELIGKNSKKKVDHINRDTLDNRKTNLRLATNQQNLWNAAKRTKACSSKYKGVSWSKRDKKWRVFINGDGKHIYIGSYGDEKNAAIAYNLVAQKFYGEFAYQNPL